MVTVRDASAPEKLEAMLNELCATYQFKLETSGWARKTYDIYWAETRLERARHIARIESLVTTNGEIRYFNDRAVNFAHDLGTWLESEFDIAEAVLIREAAPTY